MGVVIVWAHQIAYQCSLVCSSLLVALLLVCLQVVAVTVEVRAGLGVHNRAIVVAVATLVSMGLFTLCKFA